ncbi:MAG: serine/threonine-protein kinase [Phycisphaerales bacterium]
MPERGGDNPGRDRFARVEAIFAAVCDLGPDEREQRLAELCAGDDALGDEVRALLAADEHPSPALTPGVVVMQAETESVGDAPRRVGGFEIVGVLGEGGMGIVYEAIQRSPRRPVALKVIRQRTLHAKILRRFESEAQILARLRHPGIATIYESGIADEDGRGVPYVAMELVRGEPITEYAKGRGLGIEARVELFRAVCDAAAHAHGAGIVHRDLKPSNILVDAEGRPHVLDFGIAVDLGIEQRTQLTQDGQLLGTLRYMAPEQLEPDGRAPTPSTDVYALGVIGAELLLGAHPYAKHDSSIYELIHAIREGDATTLGAGEGALRGDLATIIGRAMDREPGRRYADAGELRDDLARYQRRAPIMARKPSTWYQFRRFSQRNPVLVGSVCGVMLVMAAALIAVSLALGEATRQRQMAEHDEHVKTLVNEFLTVDLFSTADPARGGDLDITLLDAMLRASEGIGERFADAPEVEAEISFLMGSQLRDLNAFVQAEAYLERSVAISQELGLHTDTVIRRRNGLTALYSDTDELDRAMSYMDTTEAMMDTGGVSARTRVETLLARGGLLFHLARTPEAEVYIRRALAVARERLGEDELTYEAISNLAIVLTRLEKYDEAAHLHEESVAYSVRVLGQDHPDTLVGLDNLGVLYLQMARYEEARELLTRVLETRRRVYGQDHHRTLITCSLLGRAYSGLGEAAQAERMLLAGHEGLRETLGADHRYTRITGKSIARHYESVGRRDLARRYADPVAP